MSTDTILNKTIVRRLYDDVWNRGDLSAAAEILAHPAGVRRYVSDFRAAFPDVRHEIREIIAEGDTVVVAWSARATHSGPYLGLPPTGRPVAWTGITIAHLVDGRIVDHDTRWDMLSFADQLGALPSGAWLPIDGETR